MKLYQIQQLGDDYNANEVYGKDLIFVSRINPMTGKLTKAKFQPDQWDNVRRIDKMLFLAWNDNNIMGMHVYVGKLQDPET